MSVNMEFQFDLERKYVGLFLKLSEYMNLGFTRIYLALMSEVSA